MLPPVLILGDYHYDLWKNVGRNPFAVMPEGWFDQFAAVILAGDIANKPKVRLAPALAALGHHVDLAKVHVFPGNHDFYDHALDQEDRLEEIVTSAGANWAQCKSLHVGDARIFCCTLWTDLKHPTIHSDIIAADLERQMNDYRKIRVAGAGYRRASPQHTAAVHRRHVDWLTEVLSESHDGPSIVVTHHAPLLEELGTTGTLGHAYGSDLTGLIRALEPDAWLYGHTHRPLEMTVGHTQVRNISMGYPFELSDEDLRERFEAAVVDLEKFAADGPRADILAGEAPALRP